MKCANSLRVMLATMVLMTAGSLWAEEVADETFDGLRRVPRSKVAVAYVHPEADFNRYKRFILLDTYVAFKKDWKREHREASTSDMERMKKGLAELFRTVFTDVLEEGGYPVVTAPGEDVLILRPAIVDLDVTAPDVRAAGRTTTYTTQAGAMTLYLEFFDSETSAILARAIDRKASRDTGLFQMSSSVHNSSEARKILTQWATILRDRLNEIHGAAASR